MVQAESSGSVEQSLLCNFLSVRIGRAEGCWWAQRSNLTSIICLSESAVVVCRTHSSMSAFVKATNQPGRPVSISNGSVLLHKVNTLRISVSIVLI